MQNMRIQGKLKIFLARRDTQIEVILHGCNSIQSSISETHSNQESRIVKKWYIMLISACTEPTRNALSVTEC